MNDAGPLPDLAHDEARLPRTEAAERWRGNFSSSDAASNQEFMDEGGMRTEEFLRLYPDEDAGGGGPRERIRWSSLFSMRALQGAVIANGGALAALALLMAAPEGGPKAGLMASAVVLGLGLMFAAISVVASVDFRGARMRLARTAAPVWLAAVSGAVSYAALALAAFPLILIAR